MLKKKSKLKCELRGTSFITAVTLYSVLVLSFVSSVLPTACTVPKYLLAIFSVITTVFGAFNAVFVSPSIAGKVNTLNKVESACTKLNSLINWSPFFISLLPFELYKRT